MTIKCVCVSYELEAYLKEERNMEPGSIGNLPLRTEAIVSVECANWHIGHAAI